MKKILVITHQLSRTGAPIVLLDLIRTCREQNYQIDVISMLEGELREELEKDNIPVTIQEHFVSDVDAFLDKVAGYDLVIANTLITYEAIHILKFTQIPVIWWLHEGEQYFEYFKSVIPDLATLPQNIHVYSVGHYVQEVIQRRYGVRTDILHFGIEDIPPAKKLDYDREKMVFLTCGTYSKVKAQDILCEAIRRIPEVYQKKAEFYFVGNTELVDEEVYQSVCSLEKEQMNVHILPGMPHMKMLEFMEGTDCLIVPSRIDPIPTVAAEIMMKERICLCTDICGIAHYIQDGENGYLAKTENVDDLSKKICQVMQERTKHEKIAKNGRKIFEQHFAKAIIEPKIIQMVDWYIGDKAEV